MNTYKKILFTSIVSLGVVASVAALFPVITHAQNFLNDDGQTEAPQLYVDKIKTDLSTYQPSETVTGTFELYNNGLSAAQKTQYTVGLVELNKVNEFFYPAGEISVSDLSENLQIPSGGQNISYSFIIPDTIPDVENLGIIITVYENGSLSAFEYAPVIITGDKQRFISYDAYFSLGEGQYNQFGLLEGPEVFVDESPVVKVNFENSAYKAAVVVPTVEIRKGVTKQAPLVVSAEGNPFSLNDVNASLQEYGLPTNIEPGVYTVVIGFADENGNQIAVPLEARYIISGIKPKIDLIYFNEVNQSTIYSFDVSVVYQDTPVGIRRDEEGNFLDPRAETYFTNEAESDVEETSGYDEGYVPPLTMSANVKLFDAVSGILISEKEGDFGAAFEAVISFAPINKYDSLRVEVELIDDGTIIDTDSVTVEIVPASDQSLGGVLNRLFADKGFVAAASLVAIIIILLLVALMMFFRKKFNNVADEVSPVQENKMVDGNNKK